MQLGDRACEILLLLLKRANSVVSKNDLLDSIWPNLAVEENTLQVHVSALRKALGPALIRTVHGRGYQYVGPPPAQSVDGADTKAEPPNAAPRTAAGSTYDGRSETSAGTKVLVVPFSNLTDDRSGDEFAEGLSEDIVIELGRYRHLTVTPYRRPPDAAQSLTATGVAREVSADFVIEGTLRFMGRAIRVNVRLIDVETGAQVWGERFDFEGADVFSVQDAIVDAVIAHLAFNLDDAARVKRQNDPTTSETAYTYFLRARSAWRAGDEALAMQLARKAVEVDPHYGRAHAYVAYFYGYSLFSQHLGLGSEETIELAEKAIEQALKCDRTDPFILQKLSMTLIMLGRPRDGLRLSEAALRIGARDGEIISNHGHALVACGAYDEGLALMEQVMSPMQPFLVPPGFYCGMGEGRHICRDYAGSLEALEMLPNPSHEVRMLKAANLARLGQPDAARRIVEDVPEGFSAARVARHFSRTCALPDDIEHWLTSFRLAGVDV